MLFNFLFWYCNCCLPLGEVIWSELWFPLLWLEFMYHGDLYPLLDLDYGSLDFDGGILSVVLRDDVLDPTS